MVLDSLLVGVMLFSSFSIRTPNYQPNPDDYEVSVGVGHSNYYINRQWERELGTKYIDDLVWAKWDDKSFIYFKPEYMNKQSQSVKYLKLDYRFPYKGATWGFTTRSTNDALNDYETFASVGISKKKKYSNDVIEVEVTFDGYMPHQTKKVILMYLNMKISSKYLGNLQTKLGYTIKEKYLN